MSNSTNCSDEQSARCWRDQPGEDTLLGVLGVLLWYYGTMVSGVLRGRFSGIVGNLLRYLSLVCTVAQGSNSLFSCCHWEAQQCRPAGFPRASCRLTSQEVGVTARIHPLGLQPPARLATSLGRFAHLWTLISNTNIPHDRSRIHGSKAIFAASQWPLPHRTITRMPSPEKAELLATPWYGLLSPSLSPDPSNFL